MNPGIYTDLSNQAYHADTAYMSSTRLKGFLPEYYQPFAGSRGALNFGTVFHTMILGVGEPVVPVTASSTRTQAYEREAAAVEADGGVPVLASDLPVLEAMRKSVEAHPHAASLLFEGAGANELSVFTSDGMKARIDRHLPGMAVDLKTTSSKPGASNLARTIIDFGYDVQAAHYIDVCETAGIGVEEFVFVFCGKSDPYPVSVVTLDESFLGRGNTLRGLALSRWYGEGLTEPYEGAETVLRLALPRWARVE